MSSDSAYANKVMIDILADLIPGFPGAANHTRCFAHVLNLVVKSILKQFDVPKNRTDIVVSEAEQELLMLSGDLDIEEASTIGQLEDNEETEDDTGGFVDEEEELSESKCLKLNQAVLPVCVMLTKVCFQTRQRFRVLTRICE